MKENRWECEHIWYCSCVPKCPCTLSTNNPESHDPYIINKMLGGWHAVLRNTAPYALDRLQTVGIIMSYSAECLLLPVADWERRVKIIWFNLSLKPQRELTCHESGASDTSKTAGSIPDYINKSAPSGGVVIARWEHQQRCLGEIAS